MLVDNIEQEPIEVKCPCCNKELLISWTIGYYEDFTRVFFDNIKPKESSTNKT